MDARLSLITLGVNSISLSREFYEKGLGWNVSSASNENVVFLKTRGAVISLFGKQELAKDAQVDGQGSGFRDFALAHNVRTKEEVAEVLNQAEIAGGRIIKPAQDVFWGGHSGYFEDPDGFLWEIAWNPHFPLDENGNVQLP
ncbi:VOC family protein [Bdellovibrio reynosensis]|uniref:VOC family protein n=1 Tax=Bdellovibrio reynosensis TaxID=2835041 RepID=A0ABY4CEN0_9BACT|nr:VOC family protein [Bdellovibrio reynosensis]UOF00670.1 VOC family protein [Bdellovibrio reynosensis]